MRSRPPTAVLPHSPHHPHPHLAALTTEPWLEADEEQETASLDDPGPNSGLCLSSAHRVTQNVCLVLPEPQTLCLYTQGHPLALTL